MKLLARYVALSLFLTVVLAVTGCSAPEAEDPDDGGAVSSQHPPSDSRLHPPPHELAGPQPNGDTNPNLYGNPPPEPTRARHDNDANTRPDGRTVKVAGPALNAGTPSSVRWGMFWQPAQDRPNGNTSAPTICNLISNNSIHNAEIWVTAVRIINQSPPSPTVFSVFTPPGPGNDQCDAGNLGGVNKSCLDNPARLDPHESYPDNASCKLGLRTTAEPGTDYTATLVYELEAKCTTTTLHPCDDKEVQDLKPSLDAPVRVTWEHTQPLLACFVARPYDNNPNISKTSPVYYPEEGGTHPTCPPRT